jgi:uncharacterized protein (TIGR02186 family)
VKPFTKRLGVAVLLGWCALRPAAAEDLVVSLSSRNVAITSSFVGENLVLFGAVEPDNGGADLNRYDSVVTVTGPRKTYRTRRKARVFGIWVNVDWREFVGVPSYLSVLSNRPVAAISSQENLRLLQIGLDNFLLTQRIGPDIADTVRDDPFRVAFVDLGRDAGLYSQDPKAVTFLTPSVFRATIPLPSQVPVGHYAVDVKLFARGAMIARGNAELDIIKVGFEQYVANAAHDHGLLYGIATAMLAILTGWLANVIFRRD